jgi:pimeloyl-ACP methyl ester carboxylesterase
MKRLILASVLAASTFWLRAPASASIPPPLPPANASFNSGSLHVDVYGTPGKPALVFIPGLNCGPWEWAGEIEKFSPDYTIYALTLPGFDGQPAIDGDLFARVGADFWSLLQTRRIRKPIVIGHSLGGTLAIMLAEQHPDELGGVVAVDGLPIFPGLENMPLEQRKAVAQRFQAMSGNLTAALPQLITSQSDVAAIAPLVLKSDPKAAGEWAAQDVMLDLRPNLSRITVPLLEVAPGAQARGYYASLLAADSAARVDAVENTRHFMMYDQPRALDAAIAGFISGIRG